MIGTIYQSDHWPGSKYFRVVNVREGTITLEGDNGARLFAKQKDHKTLALTGLSTELTKVEKPYWVYENQEQCDE